MARRMKEAGPKMPTRPIHIPTPAPSTVLADNAIGGDTITTEERVARMEGQIEHMATKADIEATRADIERLAAKLTWRMILVAGAVQALGIGALLQFLPRA